MDAAQSWVSCDAVETFPPSRVFQWGGYFRQQKAPTNVLLAPVIPVFAKCERVSNETGDKNEIVCKQNPKLLGTW